MLNKVPEVTLYFWIIKIMATTVGETAADFLDVNLGLGLTATSWVMSALLTGVLILQLVRDRYVPWIYWLAVVLVSVVGTLITDNLVDNMGVSLETTTIAFSVTLAAVFLIWYTTERTLSIHTIFTPRRELFYWAAILFTFALGTAAGDLAAEGLGWGYMHAAVIFGGAIAAITVGYYARMLNPVLAFWAAYILTRPLGASFGDFLSQPLANGGLGLGTVGTSAVFLGTIAALIVYLSVTRKDQTPPAGTKAGAATSR